MITTLKRTFSIALLLLVAMPLLFSVVFLVKQKILQSHVMDRMEETYVQTINIPLATATWIKNEKELLVNGKLFDIKSYTIEGNHIVATGFFDHEEDSLIAKYKNLVQDKKSTQSPYNQVLVKFLCHQLIIHEISFIEPDYYFKIVTPKYYFYADKLLLAYSKLNTPPPKFS